VANPWTYNGQPVTKIDIQRCRPYYGCDVCTFTLAGSADAAVPNYYEGLPSQLLCSPPPADPGAVDSSSLAGQGGVSLPALCGFSAPDGGVSPSITEIVLQPNAGPASPRSGIPNAFCQFLPGPTIAEPDGCLFTNLQNEFCVSDCQACP
jgi:hypothetical protein